MKAITHLRLIVLLTMMTILLGNSASVAQERKEVTGHSAHHEQCAKACADCMRECEMCARHCVERVGMGEKEHLITLGTCADCAEFCAAAAKIVARGGPFSLEICEACAKACERCAIACEKHPRDDHMKRCAKECRACEKACKEMVKHIGH